MTQTIPLEVLKQTLHYDPETGVWTNLIRRGARSAVGMATGSLDKHGHMVIVIAGKRFRSGRLAWFYMTGVWPPDEIDHKDRDRKNDRWENLRLATHFQNMANTGAQYNNLLGVKGVCRTKYRTRPYLAQITVRGIHCNLGTFSTVEEASAVYARAASVAFGEFARVA